MPAPKFLQLVAGKLKEAFGVTTATPDSIPALDSTGRLAMAQMPVGIGAEVVTATATENLSAGNLVNIFDNAGTISVRKADATTNGKPANGFVLAAFTTGQTVTIYMPSQINTAITGLTIGVDYYLSTTPGSLTTTPPSGSGNIVQYVGRSTKTTEIAFVPYIPIEVA